MAICKNTVSLFLRCLPEKQAVLSTTVNSENVSIFSLNLIDFSDSITALNSVKADRNAFCRT